MKNSPGGSDKATESGIPYLQDDELAGSDYLVGAIRARRNGGKLLKLDRVLLHSPPFTEGWNSMVGAVRNRLSLPPGLRELVIVAVAVINDAGYEYGQHAPEFLKAGGTREQLDALSDVPAAIENAGLFDETERAVLALTREMTRDIAVADTTMKRVRALLPERQVVELAGTIACYNMVSRFVVATGIGLE